MKRVIKTTFAILVLILGTFQIGACKKTGEAVNTNNDKKTVAKEFRTDNFAYGKLSNRLINNSIPGTVALLSCCMYYESQLQKGIAAGQKWVYTNSSKYSPQNTSFDNMVKSGKWGVNCAMPANWAYIDMGIMNEGQRFWGDTEGKFHHFDKVKNQIEAAAVVTSWNGTKKFRELFSEGRVKPGDVFLCKGHTFIYMGDNLFLAAGHDGKWHSDPDAATEDSQHAVFDTWVCDMKSNTNYNYSIYWQISFRADFIPKYYRNAAGKIVPCPVE